MATAMTARGDIKTDRSDVMDAMGKRKIYGVRASDDEISGPALERQPEPQQIIHCPAGDARHRREERRQHRTRLHPGRSARAVLQRRPAPGRRLQSNLSGGDLVNKLDAEARAERQGRTAALISHLHLPILLHPSHQQALRTNLDHRHHQPGGRRMAGRARHIHSGLCCLRCAIGRRIFRWRDPNPPRVIPGGGRAVKGSTDRCRPNPWRTVQVPCRSRRAWQGS